ncbi:MAG: zinc ribbon domain-containing protein [Planctomycetes bacterium]|nr:zinc ribbon domain-containing protein [Planctomycetota bacterium]
MTAPKFCSACGAGIPPAAKFCTGCGASLVSSPLSSPGHEAVQAAPAAVESVGQTVDPAIGPNLDVKLGSRCPFCHEPVRPSESKKACEVCMAWHHSGCWTEGAGCSVCVQAQTEPTQAPAASPPAPQPEPEEDLGPPGRLAELLATVNTDSCDFFQRWEDVPEFARKKVKKWAGVGAGEVPLLFIDNSPVRGKLGLLVTDERLVWNQKRQSPGDIALANLDSVERVSSRVLSLNGAEINLDEVRDLDIHQLRAFLDRLLAADPATRRLGGKPLAEVSARFGSMNDAPTSSPSAPTSSPSAPPGSQRLVRMADIVWVGFLSPLGALPLIGFNLYRLGRKRSAAVLAVTAFVLAMGVASVVLGLVGEPAGGSELNSTTFWVGLLVSPNCVGLVLAYILALLTHGMAYDRHKAARGPYVSMLLTLLYAVLLVGLYLNLPTLPAGSPSFKLAANQTIYYRDGATEKDARSVGEALKSTGILGAEGADVQVKRAPDEVLIVRLINTSKNTNRVFAGLLHEKLGEPVILEVCTTEFKTVQRIRSVLPLRLAENRAVFYFGGATKEDAQRVWKALGTGGDHRVDVQVKRGSGGLIVRILAPSAVPWQSEVLRASLQEKLGEPVQLDICSPTFETLRSLSPRTPVRLGEGQRLSYYGKATEEDARRVGEALKELQVVGTDGIDLGVTRDKVGLVVQVIMSVEPERDESIRTLLEEKLGGPVRLEACDEKLNTLKSYGPSPAKPKPSASPH